MHTDQISGTTSRIKYWLCLLLFLLFLSVPVRLTVAQAASYPRKADFSRNEIKGNSFPQPVVPGYSIIKIFGATGIGFAINAAEYVNVVHLVCESWFKVKKGLATAEARRELSF